MASTGKTEMVEKKVPSSLAFWAVGLFWVLFALILPLYTIVHFIIAAVLSVGVFVVARKLLPQQTVLVEKAPEPVYTGKFDLSDADRDFLSKLREADENIENEAVSAKIRKIEDISRDIFEYLSEHPEKKTDLRRFTSYYLPTVLKILAAYDRMEEQRVKGDNVVKTMAGIEKTLDTVIDAFEHQLDALHSTETLDIETDISVLESLMTQEGIGIQLPKGAASAGTSAPDTQTESEPTIHLTL